MSQLPQLQNPKKSRNFAYLIYVSLGFVILVLHYFFQPYAPDLYEDFLNFVSRGHFVGRTTLSCKTTKTEKVVCIVDIVAKKTAKGCKLHYYDDEYDFCGTSHSPHICISNFNAEYQSKDTTELTKGAWNIFLPNDRMVTLMRSNRTRLRRIHSGYRAHAMDEHRDPKHVHVIAYVHMFTDETVCPLSRPCSSVHNDFLVLDACRYARNGEWDSFLLYKPIYYLPTCYEKQKHKNKPGPGGFSYKRFMYDVDNDWYASMSPKESEPVAMKIKTSMFTEAGFNSLQLGGEEHLQKPEKKKRWLELDICKSSENSKYHFNLDTN